MKIFLYEPDDGVQESLTLTLEQECNAEVTCIGDEYTALSFLRNYHYDVAVIDYYFESEIVDKIIYLAKQASRRVYLMTTKSRIDKNYYVSGIIYKPFDVNTILKEITISVLT